MEKLAKLNSADSPAIVDDPNTTAVSSRSNWIGWSSFFFALLQSVCSAFVALSGLRLLIGAAAFGSALGLLKIADRLHMDAIRIPMMIIALLGAVFNLLALWQVRRLRARSASTWRQQSRSVKKRTSERVQLALSVLALVLLAFEYYFHIKLKG